MKHKLLVQIIQHWKKDFTEISALELSSSLSSTHSEVIKQLEQLASKGKVKLQESRLRHPIKFTEITMRDETSVIILEDYEMVDTLMAFPSRTILEQVFNKEQMDYGVFTNRLHKGDSQIKQYYFKQDVLDKYFRFPDRYNIGDDVVNGYILTKDAYYFSLPEGNRDSETFGQISYGKRRLRDKTLAIAVIVHDLSELPRQEQLYWAAYEIMNPEFAPQDKNYETYCRQNFGGEFVDYDDPLEMIYTTVKSINEITGGKLFQNDSENPYSRYLVINTEKEYQKAHAELFKLIGRDSLNKDVLLKILKERLHIPNNELLQGSRDRKEWKGQWALFNILISKVPEASFQPFKNCHDARTMDTHKIIETKLPTENLTERFRRDCVNILKQLKQLEIFIKTCPF